MIPLCASFRITQSRLLGVRFRLVSHPSPMFTPRPGMMRLPIALKNISLQAMVFPPLMAAARSMTSSSPNGIPVLEHFAINPEPGYAAIGVNVQAQVRVQRIVFVFIKFPEPGRGEIWARSPSSSAHPNQQYPTHRQAVFQPMHAADDCPGRNWYQCRNSDPSGCCQRIMAQSCPGVRLRRLSQPSIHLPRSVYLSVMKIPRPGLMRFSFSAKKSSVAYSTFSERRRRGRSVW